jgi:glutaredoxin
MDHRGVQYREIPVNEFSKPDLLQRVASAANPSQHPWLYSQGVYVGPTTVPQIWLDDEYIGGYTELNAKFG